MTAILWGVAGPCSHPGSAPTCYTARCSVPPSQWNTIHFQQYKINLSISIYLSLSVSLYLYIYLSIIYLAIYLSISQSIFTFSGVYMCLIVRTLRIDFITYNWISSIRMTLSSSIIKNYINISKTKITTIEYYKVIEYGRVWSLIQT